MRIVGSMASRGRSSGTETDPPSSGESFAAKGGKIPGSPLDMAQAKKRAKVGDVTLRAQACAEFATQPTMYKSLQDFVTKKRRVATGDDWRPSKSQMSRDMNTIFGAGWPAKRGGGGRGVAGGRAAATSAPGLNVPDDAQFLLEPNHTPTVLPSVMEQRVLKSLSQFENCFGTGIITPTLIASTATHEVLSQLPEIQSTENVASLWESDHVQSRVEIILKQLKSVRSPEWMRSFLTRHRKSVRKTVRYRSLESHKAAKHQVELVLAHFRNVYQSEAMAQIQRHMARTNATIRGFERFHNIVQQVMPSDGTSPAPSLLEVRAEKLFVRALNVPLEHVHATMRFALDETPINPDSPLTQAYTTNKGVPLSRGRASIWTLMPVLSADGRVLASLLLQRCQSLPVDTVKLTASSDLCVAATENAQQSDNSWVEFAKIWLPKCGCSFDNPGVVYIDGHTTHLTRAFIELAAKHSVYVVVEPSHTSMLLQVADVGVNRFLKRGYSQEYTASICASSLTGKVFDDLERFGCIVRTIRALESNSETIVNCFEKSALLSGYSDVKKHFPPSKFSAGSSLRDTALPRVSIDYVNAVLSLKNLAAARGAPVIVPEDLITMQQRSLSEYAVSERGFRRFYFSIGQTAVTAGGRATSAPVNEDEELDFTDRVNDGVRRMFKLGKAQNIPRGAPGRISTAYGSLASAADQWKAALRAEQTAKETIAMKDARRAARETANLREKPLADLLVAASYMNEGERLTKKHIISMLSNNSHLLVGTGLSQSSAKRTLIEALLTRIADNSVQLNSQHHPGLQTEQ